MNFGLLLIPDRKIMEIVHLSKQAEESGFDYVWIADENFYRDVYITLTAIALNTSKVKLGPGCTNPYTRHPAITALTMATLNNLSNGRAVLAIGRGGLNILNPLCIDISKPLSTLREFIDVFKRIVKGELVDYEGEVIKLRGVKLAFKHTNKIPIYVASMGPKTLRLAGEIADGVLLPSVPPEYVRIALENIEEGCVRSGRELKELDIACSVISSISSSHEKAFRLAKPYLVYCLAVMPDQVLESVGMSRRDVMPIVKALPNEKKAVEEVTDEMVEKFAIAGDIEDCMKRIREYTDAGVTQLVFSAPLGEDMGETIKSLGMELSRRFR